MTSIRAWNDDKSGAKVKYYTELDGLRAIAIISVVLFHSAPFGPVSGGFVGVDLFFVLSSYLITSLFIVEHATNGKFGFKIFYLRRLLRLWPALLFMLAAYIAAAPLVWPGHLHQASAFFAALYLSDLSLTFWGEPKYLAHSWSLAIEEQFYLVAPLALLLLVRCRAAIFWLLLGYMAMIYWRGTLHEWREYYHRPNMHSTGLLMGAALGLSGWKARPWAGWLGMAIFGVILAAGNIRQANDVITAAEIAAALIIACVAGGGMNWLGLAPLREIGKLSYGIYLWHYPIALWVRDRFEFAMAAAIVFAASTMLALISYHSVEAWGRKQRLRLANNRDSLGEIRV